MSNCNRVSLIIPVSAPHSHVQSGGGGRIGQRRSGVTWAAGRVTNSKHRKESDNRPLISQETLQLVNPEGVSQYPREPQLAWSHTDNKAHL